MNVRASFQLGLFLHKFEPFLKEKVIVKSYNTYAINNKLR